MDISENRVAHFKLHGIVERLSANDYVVNAIREICSGSDGNMDLLPALLAEHQDKNDTVSSFIALKAGTRLDHKEKLVVLRQLSMSDMSAVYLVANASNREFILKESVVSPDACEAERRIAHEMLGREAGLLSRFDHSGLPKLIDYFVVDDRHFILLEKIEGVTIRALVRKEGGQDLRDIIDWAIQISEILDYLHGQSSPILHRDLSPENLILCPDNTMRLIDFGVAGEMSDERECVVAGKVGYMAPEQFKGSARPQSDVYSLGCVMFFLATGTNPAPFLAERSLDAARLHMDFVEILRKFVRTDYSQRSSSASAELATLKSRFERRRHA